MLRVARAESSSNSPSAIPIASRARPAGGAKPLGTDESGANVIVVLDEPLAKKCNIETRRAEFTTTQAKLAPVGVDVLASVAKCLAREPDVSLYMVGHTDPRADDEYDRKLGLLRAHRARAAVASQGVRIERIAISSRGGLDAKGTEEETWKGDRRVELFLAEPRVLAGVEAPNFGPRPTMKHSSTPDARLGTPVGVSREPGRLISPRVSPTPATKR